jgi:hypothetical protein
MDQPIIQFEASEIVHPPLADVLCELFRKSLLRGEVIATTEDGRHEQRFFVVRLPDLPEPVIVPVRAVVRFCLGKDDPDAPLLVPAPDDPTG